MGSDLRRLKIRSLNVNHGEGQHSQPICSGYVSTQSKLVETSMEKVSTANLVGLKFGDASIIIFFKMH